MTTTHSHHHSDLLLLLAATPIGLGCIIVSDDTADTTGVETGNQTSGQTTTSGGTGTDSTPVTSDGTSTSGSSGESSGADSTGADSTGADSTGGGAEVCPAYADHAVKCMLPYSDYTLDSCMYQQMSVETYYPECSVLWEEYIACLSALSCEELMGVMRCPDEEAALIEMACPTIE